MFEDISVLVIDDDPTSVRVLEELVKRINVAEFGSLDSYTVQEYLDSDATPDVIFLDLEMPQINGYMVLERIQNNPRFANVPVVAYTTHTSHLNDAKRAGFHSFLSKPLNGRQFPEQLARILDGEPVWEVSG